ncbi:aldehyde dehydrogenase family protein [Streptomyces angustmyceticus]|uniref:aldehyde dehydrogenase family protein n=1 Tax=Streptomyces angustmyceticus TaxID=285578 RepID=UPI0021AEB220|nr:aldehyde dehydrogenase family protein [Streptomyces angustmyceticus]
MTALIELPGMAPGLVPVTEPATGAVLGGLPDDTADDVRDAVRAASAAQPAWAALPPAARADVLRRAALVLAENRAEAARWLVRESGSVRGKAEHEVGSVLDELWAASALPTQPYGELLPDTPGRHSFARRVPLGVVAVISPWNVPLLLGARAVLPALALGNAVVLKPDPRTRVCGGRLLAALLDRAGVPADVFRLVDGGAEVGRALVEDPAVAMVAFTGSTEVGRRIGADTGRLLKRSSLELGGNNALLVLDDADPAAAASLAAWGAFFHQGQVCMAAGRHIVLESVAEEYLHHLSRRADGLTVGDPWQEDVSLGPLIDEAQAARVQRIVDASVAAGATVRAGGTRRGPMFRPTVLAGVTPGMPAFTEEIFGPVAPVVVVPGVDEAVEVANRTSYGLVASVLTGSPERGTAVAKRLATGIVHVNDHTIDDNAFVPFGGWGASGNGSRHGAGRSWEEFTQWQWLTVRGRMRPASL